MLDLKDGRAVHAVAGRRDHYRPVQSILHPAADPLALARAFRANLGLLTLYLADLDAIAGSEPAFDLYRSLIESGLSLWIDAGITDACSASGLLTLDRAATTIVAGLESLRGPGELAQLVRHAGCERVVFSLDLLDGKPIVAAPGAWDSLERLSLAAEAIAAGVRRILLLDLSRVGTGRGPGTEKLVAQLRESNPDIRLIAGGGISRIEDVAALKEAGASGVLIGSALHDGRISARDLARLAAAGP